MSKRKNHHRPDLAAASLPPTLGADQPFAVPIHEHLTTEHAEPPPEPGSKGTIVLDPGHGGLIPQKNGSLYHDSGTNGRYEGKIVTEVEANWLLTKDIETELQQRGYKVVLTKDTLYTEHVDRDANHEAVPMAQDRTSKAPDAIAYVSIHQDDRPHRDTGIKINTTPDARPGDLAFAEEMGRQLHAPSVRNTRNIAVLKPELHQGNCNCPSCKGLPKDLAPQQAAILIEATNFSNPSDVENVMNPTKRRNMAKIIAGAIDSTASSPQVLQSMSPVTTSSVVPTVLKPEPPKL